MAGATTTTLTALIQAAYEPGIRKSFYNGSPLMRLLGTPKPIVGPDGNINWRLHYAGNSSATSAAEGQAAPAAGYQSIANMVVSTFKVYTTVQFTGEVIDAFKSGDYSGANIEMAGGRDDLIHKAEDLLVAQLIDAIDDDASYGSQTRTTVNADSVVVAGGSAALTLAGLSSMYEGLQLDDRAVDFSRPGWIVLSAPEQRTAYGEIGTGLTYGADDESTGTHRPLTTLTSDVSFDAGLAAKQIFWNGIPWITIPTMTNTYVFLFNVNDILFREARPVTIKPLGAVDDSDTFLLSVRLGLAHSNPYHAARIEALTT